MADEKPAPLVEFIREVIDAVEAPLVLSLEDAIALAERLEAEHCKPSS